jgi:hypothetical protein
VPFRFWERRLDTHTHTHTHIYIHTYICRERWGGMKFIWPFVLYTKIWLKFDYWMLAVVAAG